MTAKQSAQLEWTNAASAAWATEFAPAPGQLEDGQDFLRVGLVEFGMRGDRWKWSGYRRNRAPHGFEGVCGSREDAARAAELAYFAD